MRREFRMAQRPRLVKRGVAQWRDDDGDRPSPEPTSVVPVDEVD